jgi:hypothetical protein
MLVSSIVTNTRFGGILKTSALFFEEIKSWHFLTSDCNAFSLENQILELEKENR